MKKLLMLGVLLFASFGAAAQISVLSSQTEFEQVWNTAHTEAHNCMNMVTQIHTTSSESQEAALASFKIIDESCSAVLLGSYRLATSTINLKEFIDANGQAQKMKEFDEMRSALGMLRAVLLKLPPQQVEVLFPNFLRMVELIEATETTKKTALST